MRRRILLFAALLSGLSVVVTSLLITLLSYNHFYAAIQREVRAQASYVRSGVAVGGAEFLARLEQQPGHRVTVVDPTGRVLFDSISNPAQMDNHLDRPEIKAAFASGTGESTRYSGTLGERTYYYAVGLADGSVLRLSGTTASILASYRRLFWMVALIAAAVFFLSSVVASLVTRRIVRPINALDLDRPEDSLIYDELVPLLTRLQKQRGQIERQMQALDRGRREFTAITENMREGFLVLDREGKVLSYNKSALRFLNIAGEAAGASILRLNRSEPFRRAVHMALEGKAGEQIIPLNGVVCQLYASPVSTNGKVQGLVLLLLDVTEKQEREQLRREFTANVSHELKTPLTAISGYAELLAKGMAREEDRAEFAGHIYDEAQRLIALINDLILLSKLDENSPPPKQPVELLTLANSVAGRLAEKAKEHGVTLSVSGMEAKVLGIPSILEEMLYNLADNAIKYNRRGGSAVICIEETERAVMLSLTDSGIGIPSADLERVFERFYRVDKSHSKSVEGTGLGLAIVKHGAMLHNAEVTVSSTEKGSTFRLLFPKD